MSTKRPTPAQAQQAVELLRLFVATPTDDNVYAKSVELLAEIDTKKRTHSKRSPRWIVDCAGQHFRTGNSVTTSGGLRLEVKAINTVEQTCTLADGSVHSGKTVTKIKSKDPSPKFMKEIGQIVMELESKEGWGLQKKGLGSK